MTPSTPTPPPDVPRPPSALPDNLRSMLQTFEGVIPHLYLDTVGNVTVGCGHLLADADAACALPFVHRDLANNIPGTQTEIASEFDIVKALRAGLNAKYYASFCTLILPPSAIDSLLSQDVALIQLGLENEFPRWPAFPPDAQTALTDMGFNLGVRGLVNKFPRFCAAVKEQDWRLAATHCMRIGVAKDRNIQVQNLLVAAGRVNDPTYGDL